MKNKFNQIFFFLTLGIASSFTYGQDLQVSPSGIIFIESDSFLSVNNVNVEADGDLIVTSNASSSGSFLVNGTATGDVTYNRYLATTNWYLASAPVVEQNINSFVTEFPNNIMTNGDKIGIATYENTVQGFNNWVHYTTSTLAQSGNFNSGQGYALIRRSVGFISFKGELENNEEVAVPMLTPSGGHRWFSVGNPFTSFLPVNNTANADALNVLGQNLNNLDPAFAALYIWDGASYTAINHVSSAVQLSPGQAFMVRAKDEDEEFIFSKNLTHHPLSGLNPFSKTASAASLKLLLTDGKLEKHTEIKYLDVATTGLDAGYDAGTYGGGAASFAIDSHLVTDSNGLDFTLQCLPTNNYENTVIPLAVSANEGKSITFSAISSNLPSDMNVFIEDKTLATYKLLDENNTYEVVLSERVAGIGRFYIHTSTGSVLGAEDFDKTAMNLYKSGNSLKITGISGEEESSLRLYSILGKEIFTHSLTPGSGIQSILLPKGISIGVYVARILTKDGKEFSKKIFIN